MSGPQNDDQKNGRFIVKCLTGAMAKHSDTLSHWDIIGEESSNVKTDFSEFPIFLCFPTLFLHTFLIFLLAKPKFCYMIIG